MTEERERELLRKIEVLVVERATLREQVADLQRTFDLMWRADQRAIKLWQEKNPGNNLVWPDRSKLTGWLLNKLRVCGPSVRFKAPSPVEPWMQGRSWFSHTLMT